jgi:hypothetical protein
MTHPQVPMPFTYMDLPKGEGPKGLELRGVLERCEYNEL